MRNSLFGHLFFDITYRVGFEGVLKRFGVLEGNKNKGFRNLKFRLVTAAPGQLFSGPPLLNGMCELRKNGVTHFKRWKFAQGGHNDVQRVFFTV